MPIRNPLTEKHCQDIDYCLQTIPDIRDTIAAFEECGMDCTAEKEKLEAIQTAAATLKRKFNPLAE